MRSKGASARAEDTPKAVRAYELLKHDRDRIRTSVGASGRTGKFTHGKKRSKGRTKGRS